MGLFGKKNNETKNTSSVVASKNDLLNFLNNLINRTDDEVIKDNLRMFRQQINAIPPCADLRAINLDKNIRAMLNLFISSRFKVSSQKGEKIDENEIKRALFAEANKQIFDLVYGKVGEEIGNRKDILSEREPSKDELKKMSDYERSRYEREQEAKEIYLDMWEAEHVIMEDRIDQRKNYFEKKFNQAMQARLIEQAKRDPANKDTYARQWNIHKERIDALDVEERILAKNIEEANSLIDTMRAAMTESKKDSQRNAIGTAKRKNYSDRTRALAEKRKKHTDVTAEMQDKFKDDYAKTLPKEKAGFSDAFSSKLDESVMNTNSFDAQLGSVSQVDMSDFDRALIESTLGGN